jgi:acetolactate synthase-1/2/3 large subunit
MGYGLSGAIGAALASNGKRTVLVEGDGGFMQNLQELGTVAANRLNLKIFLFNDNGYASIRMTQSNYFGGRYIGCDLETGLGIPQWEHLFAAYSIPLMSVGPGFEQDAEFLRRFNGIGASAYLVKIDPKQTYFPKISSRITADGSMASNPLHLMSPDLPEELASKVMRYLND